MSELIKTQRCVMMLPETPQEASPFIKGNDVIIIILHPVSSPV